MTNKSINAIVYAKVYYPANNKIAKEIESILRGKIIERTMYQVNNALSTHDSIGFQVQKQITSEVV